MTAVLPVDGTLTANEVIEEALQVCGIGAEGEPITAEMYSRGLRCLNLTLGTWTAVEHLWTQTEGTVILIADTPSYVMPAGAKRVRSVRRRLLNGMIDTPMNEMSRQEYYDQPTKTSSPSTPVSFYFDPQASQGTLFVWPAPSAAVASANVLEITYLRSLATITSSGAIPDVPPEWQQALVYAVATQLALKYGVAPDIRNEIQGRASALYAQLKGWDNEPASLYLQPDYMGGSGFYR